MPTDSAKPAAAPRATEAPTAAEGSRGADTVSATPALPRSAYIHIPFCRHRCGYCNFTLLAGRDDLMDAFLDALEVGMEQHLREPRPVGTVFLGGGTPTHLAARQLARLLEIVQRWLPLQATEEQHVVEFSCEANPLDCSPELLSILRSGGVNRLSLGGQSFSSRKLQILERDHRPAELRDCLERCAATFDNLSLDLIFSVPGETLEEWCGDLAQALAAPINHLSTYGLTIERGAAFFGRSLKHKIVEVDAELQLAMYELGIERCKLAGLEHFEVSNFAYPGRQCLHNRAYWQGDPWWAFGPGAASFTWDVELQGMVRAVNHASTTTYLRRIQAGQTPIHQREVLSREQRVRERLVFGLRMMRGVALAELDQLYGQPARPLFEPALSEYVEQGWLRWSEDESRLQLSQRGLVISDSLWPRLL